MMMGGLKPTVFNSTDQNGFKIRISVTTAPLEIFRLLFDDTLLNKIVIWTNSEAHNLLENDAYVFTAM